MLFFVLMFFGASSGSTSGGIKISRHLILLKNGFLEFKRSLHPNAILPLRYNHSVVKKEVVVNILAFLMLYLILFIIGAFVLSTQGLDFISSIGFAPNLQMNLYLPCLLSLPSAVVPTTTL